MVFLEKFRKKVKETIKKVDVAVGGRLPGGVKPSEVTTKREAKKAAPSPGPAPTKKKFKETKVGQFLFGDPLTKGKEDIRMGTLPISPVGGVAGGVSAAKAIAKAKTTKSIFDVIKTGASKSQIAAKAKQLGVPVKSLTIAVKKQTYRTAVNDLTAIKANKVFLGLTKRQLTRTAKGLGIATATGLIGTAGLTIWLASDNMAGQATFQTTKIQGRFDNGELTREDALSQVDGQINIIEQSRKFINTATIANPIMWPFRKVYMSNMNNNILIAEENKRLIFESEETTSAKFERLREESDARDEAFAEMQIARDEAFKEGREKADRESDEEFQERTLLFEAIRKRNAGIELTPEELALLIQYGLDTKIVLFDYEANIPSQLSFGLL